MCNWKCIMEKLTSVNMHAVRWAEIYEKQAILLQCWRMISSLMELIVCACQSERTHIAHTTRLRLVNIFYRISLFFYYILHISDPKYMFRFSEFISKCFYSALMHLKLFISLLCVTLSFKDGLVTAVENFCKASEWMKLGIISFHVPNWK